ncbi:MAG: DUF190 domain-containing protein [Pedobacter sp.]
MGNEGKGKLLRIYLNETKRLGDKSLYEAIVEKAFKHGLAGSMVFRGIEGAGFCCKTCRTQIPSLTISKCQPMVIEFIDTEEKISTLVPILKKMVTAGAMVTMDAEVVHNVCES